MKLFYNVADEVIGFLKIINRWLELLADAQRGIPKELLYWIQHYEGGKLFSWVGRREDVTLHHKPLYMTNMPEIRIL